MLGRAQAQPLACKLSILKTRRDVRVVEGARLKSVSQLPAMVSNRYSMTLIDKVM